MAHADGVTSGSGEGVGPPWKETQGSVYPASLGAPTRTAWCFSMKSRYICQGYKSGVFCPHRPKGAQGPFIVNGTTQCPQLLCLSPILAQS